jgi:hypothetical protein
MAELNNVATGDRYTTAAQLFCPGATELTIHVRNANVYWQLGHGTPSVSWDATEKFFPAGSLGAARRCDAVRFRSATPGAPARVSVDAR